MRTRPEILREAFELASEGAEFVVSRYRNAGQNLRTQFEKIIQRAGLTPWQKPFQNLRSSRETELARLHPLHVGEFTAGCLGALSASSG